MRGLTLSAASTPRAKAPNNHLNNNFAGSQRSHRCVCRSSEFEEGPLFTGGTSDLLGPKSSPGAAAVSASSVTELLDAVSLKSGVRFSIRAPATDSALAHCNRNPGDTSASSCHGPFSAGTCLQRDVDYEPLREALKEGDFLKADDIHRKKLIEVAGEAAQERGWVYFSEVKEIPEEDMVTFDELWKASSGGKFGFSVQRQIWRACDMKWAKFFQAIDWLLGDNQKYPAWPAEFVYTVPEAKKGHLPLTNALRGTQLLEAILTHKAFTKKNSKNSWMDE